MMSANSLPNQILRFQSLYYDLDNTNLVNQFLSNYLHCRQYIFYITLHSLILSFFDIYKAVLFWLCKKSLKIREQ
ncbi:hypothetical protein AFK68_15370 [Hydrocoleum sp. CS-953]|nr:hypothetical protein AFK68_15370 [Hydrocoleum sp. CS-953]